MRRREHKTAEQKRFRFHRKPLPLPYATPPNPGEFHMDPSVRTAAELAASQHQSAA